MDWPDVWRTGMTRKTTMEGSSEDDQESLLVFIETRLHLGIPDTVTTVTEAKTPVRPAREGLCVFTKNTWCTDTAIIDGHYDVDQ